MMILALLSKNLALLPQLPWREIVVGAVVAYMIGWLWYGVFFQKHYMPLIQNQNENTNWTAMAFQLLGLLMLAYLIGIFSLFEDMFLLGVDALAGIVLFMTLAGTLFQRGNTREAVRFWLITAGYEIVAILAIAIIILVL